MDSNKSVTSCGIFLQRLFLMKYLHFPHLLLFFNFAPHFIDPASLCDCNKALRLNHLHVDDRGIHIEYII